MNRAHLYTARGPRCSTVVHFARCFFGACGISQPPPHPCPASAVVWGVLSSSARVPPTPRGRRGAASDMGHTGRRDCILVPLFMLSHEARLLVLQFVQHEVFPPPAKSLAQPNVV